MFYAHIFRDRSSDKDINDGQGDTYIFSPFSVFSERNPVDFIFKP